MEILTFGHRSKIARLMAAAALCLAACTLLAIPAAANNIQVANTVVSAPAVLGDAAKISFDISWENSWRYTNETDNAFYHDAAWVFFKVATEGDGRWRHAVLSATGTDPSGFDQGTAGANIEMIVPSDRRGVFIRRSLANEGHGTLASTNVTVLWHPQESGISSNATVRARTMAIEMVYVAEGPFWVGDGVNGFITPTWINTADATNNPVSIGSGRYAGGYPANNNNTTALKPSTNVWPNGYNAFYLMKYQGTQGQYLDFLLTLTRRQAHARTQTNIAGPEGNFPRHTIAGNWPNLFCTAPERTCTATWSDGAAYFAWAGLRPYTELEFEKACRGPNAYVTNEYAWGTTHLVAITNELGGANSGANTPLPEMANARYSSGGTPLGFGAVRAGVFAAKPAIDRESSGAGFWGHMELSGNLFERIVTMHNVQGRAYTGLHGDGTLTPYGHASVADWPASVEPDSGTGPLGSGYRGGSYQIASNLMYTSSRGYAGSLYAIQTLVPGFRGARTAP